MDKFAFFEQANNHKMLRSIPAVLLAASALQGNVDSNKPLRRAGRTIRLS